jgi:hypothetical protein
VPEFFQKNRRKPESCQARKNVPANLRVYLKNRRTKLDPASFGFSGSRRRTAELRREEVA